MRLIWLQTKKPISDVILFLPVKRGWYIVYLWWWQGVNQFRLDLIIYRLLRWHIFHGSRFNQFKHFKSWPLSKTHIHTYIYTYMYTHTHSHTHINTYTYLQTHTQKQTHAWNSSFCHPNLFIDLKLLWKLTIISFFFIFSIILIRMFMGHLA